MIRKLTNAHLHAILTVVNDAANAYKGKIPADRWKEPYMPAQELKEESKAASNSMATEKTTTYSQSWESNPSTTSH